MNNAQQIKNVNLQCLTPFLQTFAIPLLYEVSVINAKHFSTTQLLGHLSPYTTPCASDSAGFPLTLCIIQSYLLTYLLT